MVVRRRAITGSQILDVNASYSATLHWVGWVQSLSFIPVLLMNPLHHVAWRAPRSRPAVTIVEALIGPQILVLRAGNPLHPQTEGLCWQAIAEEAMTVWPWLWPCMWVTAGF